MGYSRAAGVSDLLAHKIITDNSMNIRQSNLFVYTFEAPASVENGSSFQYSCVHNIANSADLITYLPPKE